MLSKSIVPSTQIHPHTQTNLQLALWRFPCAQSRFGFDRYFNKNRGFRFRKLSQLYLQFSCVVHISSHQPAAIVRRSSMHGDSSEFGSFLGSFRWRTLLTSKRSECLGNKMGMTLNQFSPASRLHHVGRMTTNTADNTVLHRRYKQNPVKG